MFIEYTITWVPPGFSGYLWLDTKIVLKNLSFGKHINLASISIGAILSEILGGPGRPDGPAINNNLYIEL